MRLFGGERIQNMMEKFDLDEDTPIENKMLTKAIENAQTTVESRNFQSRKSVLEYDDVMNKRREIIYQRRREVLDGKDLKDTILSMTRNAIADHVAMAFGEAQALDAAGRWEMLRGPGGAVLPQGYLPVHGGRRRRQDPAGLHRPLPGGRRKDLRGQGGGDRYAPHAGAGAGHHACAWWTSTGWTTSTPWTTWKQGIRLRAYANTDPVIAYKQESLTMFEEMVSAIQTETVRRMFSVRLKKDEEVKRERVAKGMVENVGGDGTAPKKRPRQGQQDRPQRPLPLRQRPEVEEVHLQGVPRQLISRGSRLPSTSPPPVCGLVNAPKALRSKYFRHVHAAAKMIEFLDLPSADQLGKPGWVSPSPFPLGASPHSPLYLLSFVFSFLSLPLPVLSCRRAGGGLFTEGSRRG